MQVKNFRGTKKIETRERRFQLGRQLRAYHLVGKISLLFAQDFAHYFELVGL